ncbi:hypothetical protein BJ322DRAFT_1104453 [Thelephora terrestris]|uniref:Uncharacterized protein n=1 Tax=Thelephora terrestris TaxID=56493 RepID=A0A9P6LB26_9AGAM|nr:hypothetical protein BJ322DRAFT_1104453 [Thelephora terrestris]
MPDLDTTPQDGPVPPPFTRTNTSATTLYFDAMPSMSSLFSRPRVQSRSSSPERGIKSLISAPVPTDPVQNPKPIHINGHTNMGDLEDDKTTLRAAGSTHGDDDPASESPQRSSPVRAVGAAVEMSRQGNDSSAYDASSPPSAHNRPSSRSEDHHGGATDDASLRSVPVLYTNMVPDGEGGGANFSQSDVSRKVSVKRTPSKLVKRRSTKGKQTEYLVNGSIRGAVSENRRSASRTSQRSFRSSRGPVFDMITAPPNATLNDAGGAFGTGAVMAAAESEVEDELRSGLLERITIAEGSLTEKQAKRIHKEELAVSKRISKIINSEGKAEGTSLLAAIDELKDIQKMQRVAVKEETSIHASHIKSLQKCHEADVGVITAKAELEKVEAEIAARLAKVQAELNKLRVKAQAKVDRAMAEAEKARADVRARENHREASRRHSEQMTGWVKDKRKEVEVLRGWKAVDDREREVKLNELKGVRARNTS